VRQLRKFVSNMIRHGHRREFRAKAQRRKEELKSNSRFADTPDEMVKRITIV
jgi:hypothetical protein